MRVELEFSAMPDWVQAESASHVGSGKRPRCYVTVVDRTASIGPTWHDNARQTIVARRGDGETRAIRGGYYDSILNFTPEELVGHQGANIELTEPDDVVLVISLYYKANSITMYIRRDGPYMTLLSGLEDGVRLTPVQTNTLRHLAGLNSMGRKRERTYNHIPQQLIIEVARELQAMGLVKINKALAVTVTVDGRRRYSVLPKESWDWDDWRECHGYARVGGRVVNVYSGFAGEVIDEYRERMKADIARRRGS